MRSARRRSYSYAIRLRAKVCEAHFVSFIEKLTLRYREDAKRTLISWRRGAQTDFGTKISKMTDENGQGEQK